MRKLCMALSRWYWRRSIRQERKLALVDNREMWVGIIAPDGYRAKVVKYAEKARRWEDRARKHGRWVM